MKLYKHYNAGKISKFMCIMFLFHFALCCIKQIVSFILKITKILKRMFMYMYCKHSELIYFNMLLKNVQVCLKSWKYESIIKDKR